MLRRHRRTHAVVVDQCDARTTHRGEDIGLLHQLPAGRAAEAKAFLAQRTDSLKTDVAYARRLKLYRGEITPEQLITPADTEDVQLATLAFGLGNWYLVHGDKTQARQWFERSVKSGGWMGFGFIVSEVELQRMK